MADEGARALSRTRYARTIERRWSELQEQPVLLSRRDWERIDRWYARRIPLQLIEEAMTEAVEEARTARRPPRLSQLSKRVEQGWEGIVQGRRRESLEPAACDAESDALERWRHCLLALNDDSALAELLRDLLRRRGEGVPPAELDLELDLRLADAVPAALANEIESELTAELAPFRERLPADRYAATHRRARRERLRRKLDLPRLAEVRDRA